MTLASKKHLKAAAWAAAVTILVVLPVALTVGPKRDGDQQTADSAPAGAPTSAGPRPAWKVSPPESFADLVAAAVTSSNPPNVRAQAIARMGATQEPDALRVLEELAVASPSDGLSNLAAMNALWTRGERELVQRIARESSDPAVKSKALALARDGKSLGTR